GSESLTMAFSATVYSAKVAVQKLSASDQLSWTAFDGEGQVVAAGTHFGQGSESSEFSFDLASSVFTTGSAASLAEGFTKLVFGSATGGDYRIQTITLEQQFLPPSLDLSFRVDVVDGDDDVVSTSTRNDRDRKSTRLNSSHVKTSYAVFCLKKKRRG